MLQAEKEKQIDELEKELTKLRQTSAEETIVEEDPSMGAIRIKTRTHKTVAMVPKEGGGFITHEEVWLPYWLFQEGFLTK